MSAEVDRERTRNALASLSSLGAAVAGVGVGTLFAAQLAPVLWPVIGVGVIAHLYGMIGQRRFQAERGYRRAAWETVGYWLCWAALGALALYVIVTVSGGAA